MTLITRLPLTTLRKCGTLLGAAILASSLCACEHLDTSGGPSVAGWLKAESAEERHPIVVSEEPHTMRVRVGSDSGSLSHAQRADILAFANRSGLGRGSNTRVVIRAPGGSANEDAAMEVVGDIRALLASQGTPDASVSVEAYHAAEQREAPIKISVMRYVAQGPLCGQWPENLADNPENITYYNFGCSVRRTLQRWSQIPPTSKGPAPWTRVPANAAMRNGAST